MRTTYITLTLAVICVLLGGTLQAQPGINQWNFSIHAQNTVLTDSLAMLGVRIDATPGFDNVYDIPRPPRVPSGDYLEVYFPHSGGNYPPLLGTKYAVDYRGPVDPEWTMSVESSIPGEVTLIWDSVYVGSLDPAIHLFLEDASGGTIVDMRQKGSYAFTYTVKRNFLIRGAVTVNLTCLLEGFWNGLTQVRDTVTGYLARAASPHLILDSATTYLTASGQGALVFPPMSTGNYFLVVRHRNHLAVWSADSMALSRGSTSSSSYDFSQAGSAYGTNPLLQIGSVFVMFGGDVNQDGVVDYLDRNLTWNNRSQSGYRPTDCNGDNLTDAGDYSLVLNNRLKTVQKP